MCFNRDIKQFNTKKERYKKMNNTQNQIDTWNIERDEAELAAFLSRRTKALEAEAQMYDDMDVELTHIIPGYVNL